MRRHTEDLLSIRKREVQGRVVFFTGELLVEAGHALDILLERFRPLGYTPVLRRHGAGIALEAWPVRQVAPRSASA